MCNPKLVERYEKRFDLIPVINDYPKDCSKDNFHRMCYGTFKNNDDLLCEVLIEFDTNQPAYGIYYGCFVDIKYSNFNQLEMIWEQTVLSIKRDLALYWRSAQKASNKMLEDDGLDKRGFWPFWIRLEDDEDIFEAVKNVHIIINSLLTQGFISI